MANPLLAWAGTAIGLLVTAHGLSLARQARRAMEWPKTRGTVTTANDETLNGWRQGPAYRQSVTYSYRVNGEDWESNRIRFDDRAYTSSLFRVSTVYRVGDAVDVHYDPTIPSHAALEPGVLVYHVILALLGLVLAAVSVAYLAGLFH